MADDLAAAKELHEQSVLSWLRWDQLTVECQREYIERAKAALDQILGATA